MRRAISVLIFLVLFSSTTLCRANEGHLDLPGQSRLVLAHEGNFVLDAKSGFEGLTYQISAQDRKGEPAQGLLLVTKPSKEGILLRIKKEPGSRGYVGIPKVTITLGAHHDVILDKVEGTYSISNLAGAVMGTVVGGRIELNGCTGLVQLKGKTGNVSVFNHRSEGQPFDLKMKQGNVTIELGEAKNPGPGIVVLESGRLTWRLTSLIPVNFHGEVEDGLVTCNLPITRPDPKVITFTSMGGRIPWKVHLEKGVLNLNLPKPK